MTRVKTKNQMKTDSLVFDWSQTVATLLLPILLISCSGVPIHGKNGTNHYVVIGLGIVSVKEQQGVSVTDGSALGLMAGPQGMYAGWSQNHSVQIDPIAASNVVISISATPFSLTVTNFDPYSINKAEPVRSQKGTSSDE